MGRTEQVGGKITVTLLDVVNVIVVAHTHTADMVEGVVSYVMSALHHHLVDVRVFAHVVTNHEECGLYPILVQDIKYPGSNFGNGSVIEGEINRMVFRVFPEDAIRIYFAQYCCGLFEYHQFIRRSNSSHISFHSA